MILKVLMITDNNEVAYSDSNTKMIRTVRIMGMIAMSIMVRMTRGTTVISQPADADQGDGDDDDDDDDDDYR